MASKKYYVVLRGRQTGIFTSWSECEEQIEGFSGAVYKSFKNRFEAETALGLVEQTPIFPIEDKVLKWRKYKESLMPASELITESICVKASCIGNSRDVKYRGIHTGIGKEIFYKSPMTEGTNNLGEFLAIVHGLAYLQKQESPIPIYSDSETGIIWVKNKKIKITLELNGNNEAIFNLVERALKWLENNEYNNSILKWNTEVWGEIPSSFNRK